MTTWPTSLPSIFLTDGYAQGFGDGRIRSATDTGPGKVRRRSTAMASPVVGRMLMTAAQLATLEKFVATDTLGGVLTFFFPDPVTRVNTLMRFGETLPTWTHMGGTIFAVSLTLEKLP
jgi:hypothetical protein